MPREGEEDSQKAEENPTQKNQCIGVSRGGRSTKIHAVVDALGNPIHVQLSAGNVHDVKVAQEMLEAVKLRPGMAVLADKAYGKWELREFIANIGADFPTKPTGNGNCGSLSPISALIFASLPRVMNPIPGMWIGGSTRNVIWWRRFS